MNEPFADEVRVGFNPQQYTATEGIDNTVTVCVSLDRPLQRDGVMVQVETADNSALSKSSLPMANQQNITDIILPLPRWHGLHQPDPATCLQLW